MQRRRYIAMFASEDSSKTYCFPFHFLPFVKPEYKPVTTNLLLRVVIEIQGLEKKS
jgi:hypothetical protein